jgi:hypothetical protein
MKTIILKRLPPRGYVAMALWPWLIIRKEYAPVQAETIRHEEIHATQQKETGILPFYLWYGIEYLIRRLSGRSHSEAYRNISFEAEAYANEKNTEYLQKRRLWAFLKYL